MEPMGIPYSLKQLSPNFSADTKIPKKGAHNTLNPKPTRPVLLTFLDDVGNALPLRLDYQVKTIPF